MVLKLSQVSNIEWGRSDKWDVRFRTGDGPNQQYTNWLPASDLTAPIMSISSYDWSSGHMSFSIPKAKSVPDMSMTLFDDDQRTIKKFLRSWAEETFSNDRGLKYLSDIIKVIEVKPLTLQNEVVETEYYTVFLSGSLATVYNSTSSGITYPISLKVVGYSRA